MRRHAHPKQLRRLRSSRERGFALIISLVMMSFILLITMTLSLQVGLQTQIAEQNKRVTLSRQSARLSLSMGLGKLQKTMGLDRSVSFSSDQIFGDGDEATGLGRWHAALDLTQVSDEPSLAQTQNNLSWLLSTADMVGESNQIPSNLDADSDLVHVFRYDYTANPDGNAEIFAPIIRGSGSNEGIAFWIDDLGQQASIDVFDRLSQFRQSARVNPEYSQGITALQGGGQGYPPMLFTRPGVNGVPGLNPEPKLDLLNPDIQQELSRLYYEKDIGLLSIFGGADELSSADDAFIRQIQDTGTFRNYGVLTNVVDGGLRQNLQSIFTLTEIASQTSSGRSSVPVEKRPPQVFGAQGGKRQGFLEFFGETTNVPTFLDSNKALLLDSDTELTGPRVVSDFGDSSAYHRVAPILSEVAFKFGFFQTNERRPSSEAGVDPVTGVSDQFNNRVLGRFNFQLELWNPYTAPMDAYTGTSSNNFDARSYVIVVEGLPDVSITSGGSSMQKPNDMDEWEGSFEKETVDSWIQLSNNSNPYATSSKRPTLRPGEVYELIEPDDVRQPRGLVLFGGKLPEVTSSRTRVTVELEPTLVDFYLVEYGNATALVNPQEYAVCAITDVPFDGEQLQLRKNEFVFNNNTLFYVEDRFQFAYHVRLKNPEQLNDDQLEAFVRHFELRKGRFSWSDTITGEDSSYQVSDFFFRVGEFGGTALPGAAKDSFGDAFSNLDLWQDASNRNESISAPYADVRMYEVPTQAPVNISSMRHVPMQKMAHTTKEYVGQWHLGHAYPESELFNELFDRYFISTVTEMHDPVATRIKTNQSTVLPNTRLILNPAADTAGVRSLLDTPSIGNENSPGDLDGLGAAQFFMVDGAFNLNSTSVQAWRTILTSWVERLPYTSFNTSDNPASTIVLQDENGNPFGSTTTISNTEGFFTRFPFTANRSVNLVNEESRSGFNINDPDSGSVNNPYFRQGMRIFSGDSGRATIQHLAYHIVTLLKERSSDDGLGPFTSVGNFVSSGILEEAIERVGVAPVPDGYPGGVAPINEGIPIISSMFLTQADVFASIETIVQPRSDTFEIRAYGDYQNPVTGEIEGAAVIVATVQRIPDKLALSPRGDNMLNTESLADSRQFIITSIRWESPNNQ